MPLPPGGCLPPPRCPKRGASGETRMCYCCQLRKIVDTCTSYVLKDSARLCSRCLLQPAHKNITFTYIGPQHVAVGSTYGGKRMWTAATKHKNTPLSEVLSKYPVVDRSFGCVCVCRPFHQTNPAAARGTTRASSRGKGLLRRSTGSPSRRRRLLRCAPATAGSTRQGTLFLANGEGSTHESACTPSRKSKLAGTAM